MMLEYALLWPAIGFLVWIYLFIQGDRRFRVFTGCLFLGPIIAIVLIYDEIGLWRKWH